jgi:sterol desaturase/sphingolipid hydroxylase (fatty acid hydroxylase superfamily)
MNTPTNINIARRWLSKVVFPMTMVTGLGVMVLAISAGWSLTLVSSGIGAVAMGIALGLEKWMPASGSAREERELKTDLLSMGVAVGLVEPALAVVTPILVTALSLGFLPWIVPIFPGAAPLALQFVIVALVAEFGRYWAHRLGHEVDILWRFHAMHHSSHRIDFLNNFRVHPVNQIWGHVLAIVPLVWLGAGPEVMMLYTVFYSIGIIFQHIDADLDHGVLNRFFSTNVVHRWHHSKVAPEGEKNYGAVLIIWDQIFGTYFHPADRAPTHYGLYDEQGYPVHNFWGQLIVPFCGKEQNGPSGGGTRVQCCRCW